MKLETKKSNLFFYLICSILILIVSAICALCGLQWWYYPLGALLGIITHLLMYIQNKRFFRIQSNEYEKVTYSPKKDSFLWYGLRILVVAAYLVAIVFISKLYESDRALEIILLLLGGYMTIKVVFIILLLIFKEGR